MLTSDWGGSSIVVPAQQYVVVRLVRESASTISSLGLYVQYVQANEGSLYLLQYTRNCVSVSVFRTGHEVTCIRCALSQGSEGSCHWHTDV